MTTVEHRLDLLWGEILAISSRIKIEWIISEANYLNAIPHEMITMTPAQEAKALRNIAHKARGLILAIKNCDEDFVQMYISQAFRDELTKVGELDLGLPSEFEGGGPKGDRFLKRTAAGAAADILFDLDIKLTTTRHGKWADLTATLFKVATGRRCEDAQSVCIEHGIPQRCDG